jgi:hypothetical protein
VPVAAVAALPGAVDAVVAARADQLVLEPLPEGWEADDAAALGRALHALDRPRLGATELLDLRPHRERSGHFGEVLVDRDGTIGRSDGLVPGTGLQAGHRLGRLTDLTNVDRHALELADGRMLSGVPRLDVLRRRRAPADQVVASFARWLGSRDAPPRGTIAPGA